MATSPGTYGLDLYRGDSYSWRFVLWQDTAETQPLDLTGAQVGAQVRASHLGDVLAAFTCVVTVPNTIDMTLDEATSEAIPGGSYRWDLEIYWPTTGQVRTVLAGGVRVTDDVTEPVTT
jgi:hypothetical protein